MKKQKRALKTGNLDLGFLRKVLRQGVPVSLSAADYKKIDASCKTVEHIIASGKTVYSINTGFGALAKVKIPQDKFGHLQKNILLSHAAGTGGLLPDEVVRLILLLKINALAQGFSGVRRILIDYLLAFYNKAFYPCIPAKGSVGASGDLAPLSHLSLPLIGEGEVRVAGKIISGKVALKRLGLEPLTLAPKEGLALINGTQVSTALALKGLFAAEDCFAAALVAGALTVDAAKGSTTPFHPAIHRVRRQQGQIEVARAYLSLLKGSAIRKSHDTDDDPRVQDPYCLRCMPQVMGACLDQMRFSAGVLQNEANAVTDNPLVFSQDGMAYSGGNFHAEPVAMAADTLAIVLSEIGNMSERRIAMLIDHKISGLPPFLVADAGVNSGFMIAHVTAAALASENKTLAHPASVDSIPTSANQEDHVSMATFAARRLSDMADNVSTIVGIEVLAAAQGISFHAPLKTSASLQKALRLLRATVPVYTKDRYFAPDIVAVEKLVRAGAFGVFMPPAFLPSV